jgi:isopentenyldiphosphate isomerase
VTHGGPPLPADEPVDVVDERDEVIDTVTRAEIRRGHLLHRCTYVLVRRSDGRIHVHRRTHTKDVYPGAYDMLPGGVVAAGESYDVGAVRELAEELGIEGIEPRRVFTHRYSGPDGQAWGATYLVEWDGPIVEQPEEVVGSEWMTVDELDRATRERGFCADSLEIYRRLRAEGYV